MDVDNVLILRICHDLITPFNAISLGLDTFDIAEEDSIMDDVRASVDKANSILKYVRELFSDDKSTSIVAGRALLSDFMDKYKITVTVDSQSAEIPATISKILMLNGIIAKEIMPFGGQTKIEVDNMGTIVMRCYGSHLLEPSFVFNSGSVSYREVIRYYLKQLLDKNHYIVKVDRVDDAVILLEKRL